MDPVERRALLMRETRKEIIKAFRYIHEKPIEEALKIAEKIESIWHKEDIHKSEEFNEVIID